MRYEEKYYIDLNAYYYLKNSLSNILDKDTHQIHQNGYFIRSLYFDNLFNKNFIEKINGFNERKKYRIRIYDLDSKKVNFEIKNKINGLIIKESASITGEEANNIIFNEDYDCLLRYKNKILNKIYLNFKKNYYRPVVVIDYIREAFIFFYNNVRITFDTELKKNEIDFNIFSNSMNMIPVLKNKIIMEIKYNNSFPDWIKNTLKISSFEKCAISKYCLSRTI